jgi:hypothetical protein
MDRVIAFIDYASTLGGLTAYLLSLWLMWYLSKNKKLAAAVAVFCLAVPVIFAFIEPYFYGRG